MDWRTGKVQHYLPLSCLRRVLVERRFLVFTFPNQKSEGETDPSPLSSPRKSTARWSRDLLPSVRASTGNVTKVSGGDNDWDMGLERITTRNRLTSGCLSNEWIVVPNDTQSLSRIRK